MNQAPKTTSPPRDDIHPTESSLLDQVLPLATIRSFSAGEPILAPGAPTSTFYYLQDGAVEVSYTDPSDTRITVALIGAGEFFGEIGFFDGESRVRDIQAVSPCRIGIFDTRVMETMRGDHPDLFMDFILFLTRKICGKFRRIAGEREPIAGYAQSLSSRLASRYAESKPLPAPLVRSTRWHEISSRMEMFKSELFNLSHHLQKAEAEGRSAPDSEARCHGVLNELNTSLGQFAAVMQGSGYEEVMWGYIFKEIFPYFMRSRFAERAYYKPKGYAGDFLMMEHIYANVPAGEGKLGEIVDDFCLRRPGSLAIRGRRLLLKNELLRLSSDIAGRGTVTRIMNLACGPNRELFDFLAECEYSEYVEALCVDIDSEALRYTNQHVNIFPHRASIRLMSENVIKWALGRVRHHIEPLDIIYSAGLCDYLDPRLFRALISQCHRHLKPGGTLLLGNFAFYPDSLFLDKLLKWELIYRSADDLRELFAATPFGDQVEIIAEPEQVNLFAVAVKE
ncbi:cyclic nucleotide-binding domain-containing protein [Desulfobulbus alkaliphilus]|uniref:cyclic nucleotide-binding domain-containing protein n=1 Tax=Desulfobulbus alkaliphilus TaxID=869814 RepID=UPI001964D6CB|nr:cyclic nucleotide-binding domain-containing protein [Desulfobulbus alkaliphilus]MBM9538377.1 cyclic nucleotide-binding domain-containing protein [Desulfobulbus alkaliphilus]